MNLPIYKTKTNITHYNNEKSNLKEKTYEFEIFVKSQDNSSLTRIHEPENLKQALFTTGENIKMFDYGNSLKKECLQNVKEKLRTLKKKMKKSNGIRLFNNITMFKFLK